MEAILIISMLILTNDPKTTWQFRLRASNHVNPNQRNLDDNNIGNSTGLIFRSIVVGKDRKSFKSYHQAIMAIDSICRDLASGDLSSIAKQFKNVNYTQEEYNNLIESLEDVEEYEISKEDRVERNKRRKDLYDRSPDDTD